MDVLKDIASLPLKVLFSNPLVCVLVFIGAAGLLWLPELWLRPMGLDVLREEYRGWIGLVWLVYLGAVVYHLYERLKRGWETSSGERGSRRRMKARLVHLTAGQKAILTRFVQEKRSYLNLLDRSDDVRELVASGILVTGYVHNLDSMLDSYGTYRIDEWALSYVKVNPEAIWLSLEEMRLVDRRLWGEGHSGF